MTPFIAVRRLAAAAAAAALLWAAPAGASVLHAAAHRSGLAAAHARGADRHALVSSGVDCGVQTRAPAAVSAPVRVPPVPGARVPASRPAASLPAPIAAPSAADSRAPPA